MADIFVNLRTIFELVYTTLVNIQFFGISLLYILVGMTLASMFIAVFGRLIS